MSKEASGPVTELKDEELIRQFLEGRESAYDDLVRRYMEKAVQLANITVGNYEDAKDVSQEAFVKIYHALKKFRGQSKFSTWFYRILMNTAKDHIRKKKIKRFLSWKTDEAMGTFFEKVESPEAGPGKLVVTAEMGEKMAEAMRTLPHQQQWVFTLRFIEGMSLQEIADATGLAEGTVKATLHFAVSKFKTMVNLYEKEG